MNQSFKHNADDCIEVRTGEDGTWITLKTKDGGGYTFQPIKLNDEIATKWCRERAVEAIEKEG